MKRAGTPSPARILERYARDERGSLILEISAGSAQELYSHFDRHAPYVRKELDPELIDYIVESVREIGRSPFTIRFCLPDIPDDALQSRIRTSVRNYFLYLSETVEREFRRLLLHALIFLVAGAALLSFSIYMNRIVVGEESVIARVVADGLTVAAWVALWEALATLLINWAPLRRSLNINQRVAEARVQFDVPAPGKSTAP